MYPCQIAPPFTAESATIEQGQGSAWPGQEADCRRLAEARGLTISQVYVDNDLLAYSGRRCRPRSKFDEDFT
jgi:hypothetical protein